MRLDKAQSASKSLPCGLWGANIPTGVCKINGVVIVVNCCYSIGFSTTNNNKNTVYFVNTGMGLATSVANVTRVLLGFVVAIVLVVVIFIAAAVVAVLVVVVLPADYCFLFAAAVVCFFLLPLLLLLLLLLLS